MLERLARVHFFQPSELSERSPMPEYPWFFERIAGQAERAWPGDHHLRSMAGLVARELSVLRRLPGAVGTRPEAEKKAATP